MGWGDAAARSPPAVRYAVLGALLMVRGIAALIEAARHHPVAGNSGFGSGYLLPVHPASGWNTTTYDLVRIGGWALLIFGVVIVALALAREVKR
jgi:hypothetical protein